VSSCGCDFQSRGDPTGSRRAWRRIRREQIFALRAFIHSMRWEPLSP
jgi:hypothetical protein